MKVKKNNTCILNDIFLKLIDFLIRNLVLILSREIVFHNTIRNLPHNKTNLIEIS
jgi:hypothetical protein